MTPRWIGNLSFVLLAGLLALGCGHPPGVIFEPLARPVVFPAPPEPARIRYVGKLATNADLKPGVGFGQAIGQALFGKKPVEAMLDPYAACTNGRERLFVADPGRQMVHVFDLKTREYQQWQPLPGRFDEPVGVAYDSLNDRLMVADSGAATVYIFTSMGGVVAQTPPGLFVRPAGICFDTRSQRAFVADAGGHCIYVIAPNGQPITKMGSRGTALGQFNFPTNLAMDHEGRLYVADTLNFRVQQFSPDLVPIRQIGSKGDMPGYFSQPKGVACDSQNHLYVVDSHFEAVQIFDANGSLLLNFGQEGHNPGEFWLPAGIFIDERDRIWIADCYNHRVQVFDYIREAAP